jgi:predicted phage baseplate assembly protein
VTIPQINLDDRRFQDLVSEARTRISRTFPAWTDHNVSDPGITLVELFAWMTEMTIYRLNRVPDKLHIALLQLLGIRLDGPTAATTSLRFRLGETPSRPLTIPARTEVGTERTGTEDSIVFQVDDDFTIAPIRPVAYLMKRAQERRPREVNVGSDGVATPQDVDRLPFGSPSEAGDALYLGFDAPLDKLLLQVVVEAKVARGAGADPKDPILRWEVSQPEEAWAAAALVHRKADTTGGFNYGSGTVELELPPRSAPHSFGGRRLHWLRCRVDELSVSGQTGYRYERSPEIESITARPVGARLAATHAATVEREILGQSDGTPGQVFALRHRPVLEPDAERGETLEVRNPPSHVNGDARTESDQQRWVPWEIREHFAGSSETDRHFVLDAASGEIQLGPVIRDRPLRHQPERWKQYGAIPEKGAVLRFTRYRHGGGQAGNVSAGKLTVLKGTLAGVDTVVNPDRAAGGVDAETVEQARRRAAMEIRSSYRAVTADDLQFLAREASPRVGRALCLSPRGGGGGAVSVYIIPQVQGADRFLTPDDLMPDADLLTHVRDYLEERRVIGMQVELDVCAYRPFQAVVDIVARPSADTERVRDDVEHALYTFLNPLVGGSVAGLGEGWPFGRAVVKGEVLGVVYGVEGVEHVKLMQLYDYDLKTGLAPPFEAESDPDVVGTISLAPNAVAVSGVHVVEVRHGRR